MKYVLKMTAKIFCLTLFAIGLLSNETLASKSHKKHRDHGAHVHGAAALNIAFDELAGRIEFKGAADGVVGFEHEAKSEQDKKRLQDAIAKFESEIAQMVVFEKSLGCQITKDNVALESQTQEKPAAKKAHKHAEHADFIASFSVICEKSVVGSKVEVNFTSFKRIKDLDITVLVGDIQKSAEAKAKPVVIELKP